MVKKITLLGISFLTGLIIFFSCRKEHSCENCNQTGNGNKSPIAFAGPDQVISLPTDSVLLDGSTSNDPDGTITGYQWTKISGTTFFNITNVSMAKTIVRNLVVGVYQFELKVTDDKGLSAKDTMQVIVNDPTQPNRPPTANAGMDQAITLPTSTISLDGSASTDPDNNITSYRWTKISGPLSFTIGNPNTVQTQVVNLTAGIYMFELMVTDAFGLFAKDTVSITVNHLCDNSNWPIINATFNEIGILSEPRSPGAGAFENKIVFAGGWKQAASCCFWCGEYTVGSSVADIYDLNTASWETHQLSKARLIGASAGIGDKMIFAGGTSWVIHSNGEWDESYDNVDIYNVATNSWEEAHLTKARERISSAVIGNKVFFAGGTYYTGNVYPNQVWNVSSVVDIYDYSTNSWSATNLSVPRSGINSVVIGDKIYFVGGTGYMSNFANVVDIYNNTTNTWTTSDLQTVVTSLSPPPGMGIIDKFYNVGNNIIFWNSQNQVGIRNLNTGSSSTACIPFSPAYEVNNKIIFFDGKSLIDIYDPATGIWSVGKTSQSIPTGIDFSVIQLNNSLYLGGGWAGSNGATCIFSDKVYRISF